MPRLGAALRRRHGRDQDGGYWNSSNGGPAEQVMAKLQQWLSPEQMAELHELCDGAGEEDEFYEDYDDDDRRDQSTSARNHSRNRYVRTRQTVRSNVATRPSGRRCRRRNPTWLTAPGGSSGKRCCRRWHRSSTRHDPRRRH